MYYLGPKKDPSKQQVEHGILFDPEDEGSTFLRNVGKLLPD
jgi:hypothetical protein